jgi:MFS transporter, DHA1 family, inner membrane transport protein
MKKELPLLILLGAIQFTNVLDFMIIMPLGDELMEVFKILPHQFGIIVSAYTITAGCSGIIASFYLDRFDRKKTLLITYAGLITGTFLCSISITYESLVLSRIFTGIFGGILGAQVFAIVADVIPFERRGRAMGIIMAAFSVASVVGVPLGMLISSLYNWQTTFMCIACAGIPIWFLAFRLIPPIRTHLENRKKESPLQTLAYIFSGPNQRYALALMITMMLGHFMLVPNVAIYMVRNVGIERDQLLWIYLIGGLVTLQTNPFIGKLADRHGKQRIAIIFILLTCIPILLITNLAPSPLWIVILVTSMFFAFSSGRFGPAQALISETVDPAHRGAFMSFISAMQHMGAGIASLAAGFIMGITEEEVALVNFNIVGYTAIAISLVTLIFVQKINLAKK